MKSPRLVSSDEVIKDLAISQGQSYEISTIFVRNVQHKVLFAIQALSKEVEKLAKKGD